jgi:translation initiation factor RLI1
LSSFLFLSLFLYSQKCITIPIFNSEVLIFNELQSYLDYTNQKNLQDIDCETIELESEVVSYIKDSTCLDHELIHVTWFVLSYYGIELTPTNHEIQSYLFEYIKSEYKK